MGEAELEPLVVADADTEVLADVVVEGDGEGEDVGDVDAVVDADAEADADDEVLCGSTDMGPQGRVEGEE